MMKLRKIFKKKQNLEQIIESTSLVTDEDEINTNDLLLLVDVLTNQDKQKEKSKI